MATINLNKHRDNILEIKTDREFNDTEREQLIVVKDGTLIFQKEGTYGMFLITPQELHKRKDGEYAYSVFYSNWDGKNAVIDNGVLILK